MPGQSDEFPTTSSKDSAKPRIILRIKNGKIDKKNGTRRKRQFNDAEDEEKAPAQCPENLWQREVPLEVLRMVFQYVISEDGAIPFLPR